jgi:hypothetical protein
MTGGPSLQAAALFWADKFNTPDTLKNLSAVLQRGELLIAMLGMFWLYSQGSWRFGRNQVASVGFSNCGAWLIVEVVSAKPLLQPDTDVTNTHLPAVTHFEPRDSPPCIYFINLY